MLPKMGQTGHRALPTLSEPPVPLFAIATLLPAALLCLGVLLGGVWVWSGVLLMTLGVYAVDRLAQGPVTGRPEGSEFPASDALGTLLALMHLPMLLLAVHGVAGADHDWAGRLGILIGFGLFFGQVGHPNAHELIHRPSRALRILGVMSYSTLLMGHHVSAHRLVHHSHVGTDADPNSAPKGLGFWRFAPQAWVKSYLAGRKAEQSLRARANTGTSNLPPHVIYALWAAGVLVASAVMAGWGGVLALGLIAVYAQIQILLADYVQHYGLCRKTDPQGKPEPVGPQHAWNSPHSGSSAMMLNAPRHADHHLHPLRPYPALELRPDMPVLPYSVPVMAVIALVPPLWRRVMDPRVAAANEG